MGKPVTPINTIKRIKYLREKGYSLPEIARDTGIGKTTAFRYIKGIEVLPDFKEVLKSKQGGSIARSKRLWGESRVKAKNLLGSINDKERLVALLCLYWSEGAKGDFSFINGDPAMIRALVESIALIGVKKDRLRFSLRVFEDAQVDKAKDFWSRVLDIPKSYINSVIVLSGKKEGKLKYGMCRIRIVKGGEHFKLMMSMIDLLKSEMVPAAVVQRIEQGFPKP